MSLQNSHTIRPHILNISIITIEVSELQHGKHINCDFKCFRDIPNCIQPHSFWTITKSKLEIKMSKKATGLTYSEKIPL